MSIKRTGKIWLGIGTAAVIGAGGASTASTQQPAASARLAQAQLDGAKGGAPHAGHDAAAPQTAGKPGQDGEGSEGGEGAAANLDSRVRFFRDMGLIRGHLLVGDELVKAGLWADALPHFHHPIEELYTWIGVRLKGQGVRQFDGPLKALAQTVQAKNPDAYANALKVVRQRMDEAEKAMRKFANPYLQFRMRTVIAMLQAAAGEYKEALEDGKITKPVEYQDSRGFVLEAEAMLNADAADLGKKDKAAFEATRAALTELARAWPAPLPPATAVKDHAQVLADVSRVELAASSLTAD